MKVNEILGYEARTLHAYRGKLLLVVEMKVLPFLGSLYICLSPEGSLRL